MTPPKTSDCNESAMASFAPAHGYAAALERVVADMADGYKWNWTRMMSHRDAADAALRVLFREGLIEQVEHPSGGRIWRVNGKLFGRTDEITHKKFDELKRHNDQAQRPPIQRDEQH